MSPLAIERGLEAAFPFSADPSAGWLLPDSEQSGFVSVGDQGLGVMGWTGRVRSC